MFGRRRSSETPQTARQPGIWLYRAPSLGLSRLGGLPNLAAGKAWPRHGETDTPLHFIGQVDLGDMPRTPLGPGLLALPRSGLLMFFADIDEDMLWNDAPQACTRVVYARAAGMERAAPDDLPLIGHAFGSRDGGYAKDIAIYPAQPLKAAIIDTFALYPLYFSRGDGKAEADRITAASIERALGAPLPKVELGAHNEVTAAWLSSGGHESLCLRRHLLLGAPVAVQNSAAGAMAAGDIPLMQFDTDWGVDRGFMFCDYGMAQYWIKPDDLAQERFEAAWATTEGG